MRVLNSLSGARMTVAQIAQELGISASSVALHIAALRRSPKQIYICGHDGKAGKPVHGGCPAPIWTAGSKPDAEFVPLRSPSPKITSYQRQEQIIAILKRGPRTTAQLSEVMHIVRAKVNDHLRKLRVDGNKRIYIKHWNHPALVARPGTGGDWAPVYAIGDKPDAPKPKKETSKDRHRRLMQDPVYREDRKKGARKRYQITKLRKKPQGIFAALGL